ncbi:MAG TPA: transglutaminase [Nitrospiraceae bacterium]|nr:transglutaminase [Nitrospiraceae bacterium]
MKALRFVFVTAIVFSLAASAFAAGAKARERSAEVTVNVGLQTPAESKNVRLWIPYPVSDENQTIEDVNIKGNFSKSSIYRDGRYGNMALYAEWNGSSKERLLTYTFKVKRREVIKKDFPKKELSFSKYEFREYLTATSFGPTDGKVRALAEKITKGAKTNLAKARLIYDWIVSNMYRDPNIKGCGFGEVDKLLVSMGGKCGDIHSVFVALSRSIGVPAREIFGIRIPKGKEGDMTKAQHCWAEFYLPGYGWVPVDPSDVRKAMLEKKTDSLNEVKSLVEYFFGAVDESRIAYQSGRDLILNPQQKEGKLNYFMYPYAEADGKTLNEDLFGFNLGYKISFKEL